VRAWSDQPPATAAHRISRTEAIEDDDATCIAEARRAPDREIVPRGQRVE
jgi:hypothetical protein